MKTIQKSIIVYLCGAVGLTFAYPAKVHRLYHPLARHTCIMRYVHLDNNNGIFSLVLMWPPL